MLNVLFPFTFDVLSYMHLKLSSRMCWTHPRCCRQPRTDSAAARRVLATVVFAVDINKMSRFCCRSLQKKITLESIIVFRFEVFIWLLHNDLFSLSVRGNEDPFRCLVDLWSICEQSWNIAFGHLLWWRNEIVGEGKLSGYGWGRGWWWCCWGGMGLFHCRKLILSMCSLCSQPTSR